MESSTITAADDKGTERRRAGRPSAEEADRLEREVLAAALKEFHAQGLGGASIERIARVAGVTRSALYRRYGDKRRLFERVLDQQVGILKGLGEEVMRSSADPLARLRETARAYCRYIASPTVVDLQRMMIWRAANPDDHAIPDVPSLPSDLSDQLDGIIAVAQAAGQLRPGRAAHWRDVLLRLVAEGVRWKALASSLPLTDAILDADFDRMWPIFVGIAGTEPA